jgi:hypothetical protein
MRRLGFEPKSLRTYVRSVTALPHWFGRKENKTQEEDRENGGLKKWKGINNAKNCTKEKKERLKANTNK